MFVSHANAITSCFLDSLRRSVGGWASACTMLESHLAAPRWQVQAGVIRSGARFPRVLMTGYRACMLLLAASCSPDDILAQGHTHEASRSGPATPEGISPEDWSAICAAYDVGRYAARPSGNGYEALNPGQQWRTFFDGRAFVTAPESGGWTWGLELKGYGFAGYEEELTLSECFHARGEQVGYRWDATLEEWYKNDARGLEHGYTLHRRPCGLGGVLTLTLAVRGDLDPVVSRDGRGINFENSQGAVVLTYSGLAVVDAEGRELDARFALEGEYLRLSVAENGARYPVTIDPVAQQAYLKASNSGAEDLFGWSVAVSGATAVVGAPGESSSSHSVNGGQNDNTAYAAGAAYVFVRSGGVWSQQAYLKASNSEAYDYFGWSVAVSGDIVAVSALWEDSNAIGTDGDQTNNNAPDAGAVYVFVRNGTSWSQEAYLKASNTDAGDRFGVRLGMSNETLVVGADREDSSATGVGGLQTDDSARDSGAAYVFIRSGTNWIQQAYLKASNTDAGDLFGSAVGVSEDTIVIGAHLEDSNATGVNGQQGAGASDSGAAYVFARDINGWSQGGYLKASNTGVTGSGILWRWQETLP